MLNRRKLSTYATLWHGSSSGFPTFDSVKYLAYIFSVYIFVLACLPCTDSTECDDYTQASQVAQADTHQDHSHETEACSSFCLCSCCGQQISQLSFSNPLPQPKSPVQEETKAHSLYRSSACPDFYGNIWQPPKIA